MAIETRFFELHEGTSNKFWTIALEDTSHTVRFGRKGTVGQEQHKEFDNNPAARAAFDKLIAEKLKKGYHEVDAGSVNAPPAEEHGAPLSPLRRALVAIDLYLKREDSDTYQALQRGASQKDLALLSKEVFGGGPVPPDLMEWFSWHNGQKEGEEVELVPGRTFFLMNVAEVVKLCKEYRACEEDWIRRWDKAWVPFMENGAGDYMCYVPSSGKTIKYWHDGPEDEGGVEDFDNLHHLAKSVME
jgi:predicted DNA-binding WGR domain protein/cell wall assembly regulator SMI1